MRLCGAQGAQGLHTTHALHSKCHVHNEVQHRLDTCNGTATAHKLEQLNLQRSVACRKATVGKLDVALGDVVQLAADEEGDGEDSDASAEPALGLVQAMWQSASGELEGPLI